MAKTYARRNLAAAKKMVILQPIPLFNRHIMRPALLLQCIITELQPVITELMVG